MRQCWLCYGDNNGAGDTCPRCMAEIAARDRAIKAATVAVQSRPIMGDEWKGLRGRGEEDRPQYRRVNRSEIGTKWPWHDHRNLKCPWAIGGNSCECEEGKAPWIDIMKRMPIDDSVVEVLTDKGRIARGFWVGPYWYSEAGLFMFPELEGEAITHWRRIS